MASSQALTGIELIDCAKASAKQGIVVAAQQCGYGDDLNRFQSELEQACQHIGVNITELSDLITDQQQILQTEGIEIAPDTTAEL